MTHRKNVIHFAHGNGFSSPCYSQLMNVLRLDYQIKYIDMIGHNQMYPVSDNWCYLIDELILSIETQCSIPVIGLGHSLGGVLTMLASFKKPELFEKVILLDAPRFSLTKSSIIKILKKLSLIDVVTPSRKIRNRTKSWSDLGELNEYLKTKKLFRNFSPHCLNDYIKYGMIQNKDGSFELKFDRLTESEIYKTVPHNMHLYPVKQKVPTLLIYGSSSDIITRHVLSKMRKKYQIKTMLCDGGHMFPMEHPQLAGKLIDKAINLL